MAQCLALHGEWLPTLVGFITKEFQMGFLYRKSAYFFTTWITG